MLAYFTRRVETATENWDTWEKRKKNIHMLRMMTSAMDLLSIVCVGLKKYLITIKYEVLISAKLKKILKCHGSSL